MDTLGMMESICNRFKGREYDLEEFQSRLESLMISDDIKSDLARVRSEAVNRLEEIKFCSLESNFQQYGEEVADSLLKVVGQLQLLTS